MKKFYLLISILSIIVITNSCDSNDPILPPMKDYPFALNREWEYETIVTFEIYDSLGNIDTTKHSVNTIIQHSLVKVIDVNVNLAEYSNLFILEDFLLEENQYRGRNWYLDSDSGLYHIADSSTPGSSFFVIPKVRQRKYLTLSEVKEIINLLKMNIVPTSKQDDSIYFYEKPRKVYNYSLKINDKWVELIFPFYREKYVIAQEQIKINNNYYDCFVIKSISPDLRGLEIYDYVNPVIGLIQKKIIMDSIETTTIKNPDSGNFNRITNISRLIRKNF